MKKILSLLLSLALLMGFAACTPEEPDKDGKTLVVYFSATGNTERVAEVIAEEQNADILELVPVKPYTEIDLNWRMEDSRVCREYQDPSLRSVELRQSTVENWEAYDTVFIGYPLWWQIAAWPVDTFVKANDFTGKTVIPFCTSTTSELGQSGELLAQMAGTGNWQKGIRFGSGISREGVEAWLKELNLE